MKMISETVFSALFTNVLFGQLYIKRIEKLN